MATRRDELHKLIDGLPEEKLPSLGDLLDGLYDENERELTDKTKREIDEARERIKNGEYVTLDKLLEGNQADV